MRPSTASATCLKRGLYMDLKLEPTLVYLATLKGLDEAEARRRLADWLKRFDLYDHRHKKVQDLSKGMQQKAQIIATLVHQPDLIIVDEPFSGLDPVNTRLVKDVIEEQRTAGRTIIMSTHQMYQVEALCNRIVLIDHGRSVLYGEVSQIKRDFAANAVLVQGQGDFSRLQGVLEARRENGSWHLALAPGVGPQEIFRALAARDDLKVERFELAEPSLDDIFVTVVQGGGWRRPSCDPGGFLCVTYGSLPGTSTRAWSSAGRSSWRRSVCCCSFSA